MPGQMASDGAFSRSGRAINRNNDLSARLQSAQGVVFRTHARFLVSCLGWVLALGRAVKPYLLLFPALAPGVNAGLRLLRTGRASGRESLRGAPLLRRAVPPRLALVLRALAPGLAVLLAPFVCPLPLRRPHAGAADFVARPAVAPFAGRLALPLEWIPLLEPLPE